MSDQVAAQNPNYPMPPRAQTLDQGQGLTPPKPVEPTIKERASGLLSVMTDAQRHNAPITPWMLTELAAVVGHVTGNKAVTVPHLILSARGLPDEVMLRKPDGTVAVVYSAEEALAYVRSLPKDVQARAWWVAADAALVDAMASVMGADVSPAIRLFSAALAEDRKLDAKPVEIKDKPADDIKAQAKAAAAPLPGAPAPVSFAQREEARLKAEHEALLAAHPAPVPAV